MIRRLYVHNFRCLENFDLKFGETRSVLLLGKNGAGKSTVGLSLEKLQMLARGNKRVGDLVAPRDLTNGRAIAPMRFEIEVELEGDVYLYSIAFEFPSAFRELRVFDEKLEVNGGPIFTRKLAEVRIARSPVSEAAIRIDWHLPALPIVQEQSVREPLSLFKTWLRDILILRPVPSRFRGDSDGSAPTMIDPEAVGIGSWFTEMMASAPETYSHVSDYLHNVMPDFDKITNLPVAKNARELVFNFSQAQQKLELDLDQLSDGEKCFVLYSLVIAASASRRPLFCFWDEPDNFLAPDEVGQSIMGLRRAFRDAGQLLITSHNPETIRRFSEDQTLYLARRSHFEPTTYQTIDALRATGEYAGSFIDALLRGDIGANAEA